jgi:hypothetical protein
MKLDEGPAKNLRIWKWTLAVTDAQVLSMPVGAEVLTVQTQGDELQLWALCDTVAAREDRVFEIHGTGNPVSGRPGKYIATFQMHDGALVFHVFERASAEARTQYQ